MHSQLQKEITTINLLNVFQNAILHKSVNKKKKRKIPTTFGNFALDI